MAVPGPYDECRLRPRWQRSESARILSGRTGMERFRVLNQQELNRSATGVDRSWFTDCRTTCRRSAGRYRSRAVLPADPPPSLPPQVLATNSTCVRRRFGENFLRLHCHSVDHPTYRDFPGVEKTSAARRGANEA